VDEADDARQHLGGRLSHGLGVAGHLGVCIQQPEEVWADEQIAEQLQRGPCHACGGRMRGVLGAWVRTCVAVRLDCRALPHVTAAAYALQQQQQRQVWLRAHAGGWCRSSHPATYQPPAAVRIVYRCFHRARETNSTPSGPLLTEDPDRFCARPHIRLHAKVLIAVKVLHCYIRVVLITPVQEIGGQLGALPFEAVVRGLDCLGSGWCLLNALVMR